jgi:hypothetical protein
MLLSKLKGPASAGFVETVHDDSRALQRYVG